MKNDIPSIDVVDKAIDEVRRVSEANNQEPFDRALDLMRGEHTFHEVEAYIRTYLELTGLTIDQVEFCMERRSLTTTIWYCRKRGSV